ncbi:Antibiotic biosynthesis monooxygenase OS=Streptomyces alboniger OX=132473 GN=CP975_21235 PE=4 SV=1 [Streptomyces alboniger]
MLVITWWDAAFDADLPELPEPAQELVTRAVHRWRFESADAQHL